MTMHYSSNSKTAPYERYVSIHSEDRDMVKYPNSNVFGLQLPEDILNVTDAQLIEWTFPSNYYTFSKDLDNLRFIFTVDEPAYPIFTETTDIHIKQLQYDIYTVLICNRKIEHEFNITEGFYTPKQMQNELRERLNKTIFDSLIYYFSNPSEINDIEDYQTDLSHNDFINSLNYLQVDKYEYFNVVYDEVKQKMLFGNTQDRFTFKISSLFDKKILNNKKIKDFSNWGLPSHLGFVMCDHTAESKIPELYHSNLELTEGYWIEPKTTVNLMGPSHFYLEIDELNCLDETSSFVFNKSSMQTNLTNGRIKSAFAKIPIESTPMTQYFGLNAPTKKSFRPMKKNIRKLNIKCRYHNGLPVSFGQNNFSFTIKFTSEI